MQSSEDAIWTRGLSLKLAAMLAGFTYLLNPVTSKRSLRLNSSLWSDHLDGDGAYRSQRS